jgi:hypothetical protein
MSRASNLAGFSTSISPPANLSVGIVTAVSFVGDVTGDASGLSGTPNLSVGVVTATSFVGDGTDLDLSNNPTAGGSFAPVNYIIN